MVQKKMAFIDLTRETVVDGKMRPSSSASRKKGRRFTFEWRAAASAAPPTARPPPSRCCWKPPHLLRQRVPCAMAGLAAAEVDGGLGVSWRAGGA
jgi:hypothetical protein